jgi:hypothetical protein
MKYILISTFILISILTLKSAHSEELYVDYQGTFKAKILTITEGREENVGFSDVLAKYQNLEVRFFNGPQKDQTIAFESDFPNLKEGQKIYVNYNINSGNDVYAITNSIDIIS